jgi:hypothetical protein
MKIIGYISLFVCAAAVLAACNQTTGGPYASARYPSGYGTINNPKAFTCGPDWQVCQNERRDARDRGQQ